MANDTLLARDYELEVNTGDDVTPSWVPFRGWTSLEPSPETERTDDTHAHSGGWSMHKVSQRGVSFSFEALELRDDTGALDPGQQAVRDLAEAIGTDAKGGFRYYHKASGDGFEFDASVECSWPGGEQNANAAISGTLTIDGKPTSVTITTP